MMTRILTAVCLATFLFANVDDAAAETKTKTKTVHKHKCVFKQKTVKKETTKAQVFPSNYQKIMQKR